MRLIAPGPGEYLDRAAILRLKIAATQAAGRSYSGLQAELKEISRLVYEQTLPGCVPEVDPLADQLFWLNRRVWDLVDWMHNPSAADKDMATWARETVGLNDRRAQLISEINVLCGFAAGEEKL